MDNCWICNIRLPSDIGHELRIKDRQDKKHRNRPYLLCDECFKMIEEILSQKEG